MADQQEKQTCEGNTHQGKTVPEEPTFQEHNDAHCRKHSKKL